jgi:SAM-dependent methyltransferase
VARREVILAALRRAVPDFRSRRLFDIGCGTGALLEFLGKSGVPLAGACDAFPESLRRVRSRLDLPLVLVDEGRLPPLGGGLDLAGMFDVLEHLDDDLGAFRAVRGALAPGGALVLTVPAHPILFGDMDEIACHRRRYRCADLRRRLERAGFEVRLVGHFMAPLVPMLLALRLLRRWLPGDRTHAAGRLELRLLPGVNGVMRALLALERVAMRVVPMPFGSSLVAVAVARAR